MKQFIIILILMLFLALMGCSSSSDSSTNIADNTGSIDDSTDDDSTNDKFTGYTLEIDASDYDNFVYLDLATASILTSEDIADASQSLIWDMAFRRTTIQLNGGVSGSKAVSGYYTENNQDFYDENGEAIVSRFENASADSELEDLLAVTIVPEEAEFIEDSYIPAIKGNGTEEGWWLYDITTHTVSANTEGWWIIRSAEGDSYAKMRVTAIDQENKGLNIAFYIQAAGESSFSDTVQQAEIIIGSAGGTLCFDFDNFEETTCEYSEDIWDLQVDINGSNWNLWTNGGVYGEGLGAAFGIMDQTTVASFNSGTEVPVWTEDSTGGVFEDYIWYAYNLAEAHQLWPNYRVYLIQSNNIYYRLQILSYYNLAGTSGHITVRYDVLP